MHAYSDPKVVLTISAAFTSKIFRKMKIKFRIRML
jgi:hypothetical protein